MPKLLGNVGFSKMKSNYIQGIKPKKLVILVQGFITKKMVAYRLALRELSQEASAALQLL